MVKLFEHNVIYVNTYVKGRNLKHFFKAFIARDIL